MSTSVKIYTDLIGKTCSNVSKGLDKFRYDEGDALIFILEEGTKFAFAHDQDCCEYVRIEEIIGDLSDLVGSPIITAESVSNNEINKTQTWTFFKFATNKGSVTVRWLGESNGYYSEDVDFWYFCTIEKKWKRNI